jgi:3-hydroxyisobutyrate dehydrogenase-like beta-hydroxyacid dehydrogenase
MNPTENPETLSAPNSAETSSTALKMAFIGTGTMGFPMAERFIRAGYSPLIYDQNPQCVDALVELGGRRASDLMQVSSSANVVFLSLPGPIQVQEVVSGEQGLMHNLKPDSVIVDLSTSAAETSRRLSQQCRTRDIQFLDAPVSGGVKGCRDGSLILMMGGHQPTVDKIRPLLDVISREVVYLGESGSGNIAKLVHNQLYLCGEVLFYEALVLAGKSGVELPTLIKILNDSGLGGIHTKMSGRVLERQHDQPVFSLALAEKDVALALSEGRSLDVPMPASSAAHQTLLAARAAGFGNRNFWSAIEILERNANFRLDASNAN